MYYVDVILPLPLRTLFTYGVADNIGRKITVGCRVHVPLGKKDKGYTAIVVSVHQNKPESYQVKNILDCPDQTPLFTPLQMEFMNWISAYYMAAPGDVVKSMLPSLLRGGDDSKAQYKPKYVQYLKLSVNALNAESLSELTVRQSALLECYKELSGYSANGVELVQISRKTLLENAQCSDVPLNALLERQILEYYKVQVGRIPEYDGVLIAPKELSKAQHAAMTGIETAFKDGKVCLLHGATASGKTEIYIHLIKKAIQSGGQALFMLPEIALTIQIMKRLQVVFGDDMIVYHSAMSQNERVEVWKKQLSSNPYKVVVGPRSALMLPYADLKLIVVDEEHDSSYKQSDSSPRYNGRDCAVWLAKKCGADILLGSATPCIESYYNALSGKYALVELKERYCNIEPPRVEVADMYQLHRKKIIKGYFAPILLSNIQNALDAGRQAIIFQNRRGYTPVLMCKECGWTAECDNCNTTLTFHKAESKLSCHYCSSSYSIPDSCPKCGSKSFTVKGLGTERIQEQLQYLFPKASVARLDLDSASTVAQYNAVLHSFHEHESQILVGTQMVTKGLDFGGVSVVGIIEGQNLSTKADFRASERAFQLMVQVAGRAGRKDRPGTVVLQTTQPDEPIVRYVVDNDYKGFYGQVIQERKDLLYPPFCRLIEILVKHKNAGTVTSGAGMLARELKSRLGNNVLGPESPAIDRIGTLNIRRILVKADSRLSVSSIKEFICNAADRLQEQSHYAALQISFNVDP